MCNQPAKILVVDDDPLNQEVVEAFLKLAHYDVLLAYNGTKALQLAASASPDLIILDVKLPDMSGFEVCTLLKSTPATRTIPILMLTALEDQQVEQDSLAAGADAFMRRHYVSEELLNHVQNLLKS